MVLEVTLLVVIADAPALGPYHIPVVLVAKITEAVVPQLPLLVPMAGHHGHVALVDVAVHIHITFPTHQPKMLPQAECSKELDVAVRVVAVPTECVEIVWFAVQAIGELNLVGATKVVLHASVVEVGEAARYVAIEERRTRLEGDLFRGVRVVAVSAGTLATRESCVRVDGIVVAALALANATVGETVLPAEVHVSAVHFVAAPVDVVQVDGNEEALDLIG